MALELESVMDCLCNPLKTRVLIMFKENGPLTPKQMLTLDPKIPQASLYRALKTLEDKQLIVTVSENKVRAVVEKRYYLNDELKASIGKLVSNNNGEAYFNLFLGFAFGLMRRFEDYSKRDDIDLKNDGSGFFSVPVFATTDELEEMYSKIMEIVRSSQTRKSDDQKQHTLAFVVTPPSDD